MSAYQDMPWPEDEHAVGSYSSTLPDYRRSWRGMPLRRDWNSGPIRSGCQTCEHCGYKWDQTDFTYRSGRLVNGKPEPVAIHRICWNCWMAETNPIHIRAIWDAVERQGAQGVSVKTTQAVLKPIGGKE